MDAEPDTVDEDLWGPTPTGAQLGAAAQSAQRESDARLAQVRAVSVTAEEAARRTRVRGDAVIAAIAAKQLLAVVAADGQLLVPTWQLATSGSAVGSKPALAGVADLVMAFPGGTVALTLWARKPSVDLDGRTPAQALADGHAEAVVATARALTAAGW